MAPVFSAESKCKNLKIESLTILAYQFFKVSDMQMFFTYGDPLKEFIGYLPPLGLSVFFQNYEAQGAGAQLDHPTHPCPISPAPPPPQDA